MAKQSSLGRESKSKGKKSHGVLETFYPVPCCNDMFHAQVSPQTMQARIKT